MAYRPGEAVGPYEVLQRLGRGSFSIVLLGKDLRQPSQRVALKVVPCDHLDVREATRAKEQALAEAELLQRLRHDHIVSCHQVSWDETRRAVWLALDFMDGGDLQVLLDRHRRAGQQCAEAIFTRRVFVAVGGALAYIHAQGVLHRDVKPSNVLLSGESKQIRLADFGISKILETARLAYTAVGTPFYLSPEIVQGEPYGPAADAWALGICLYELASLKRPFEALNQLALAVCIVQQEPHPLPVSCPADVVRCIVNLLNKDPSRRLRLDEAAILEEAHSREGESLMALAAARKDKDKELSHVVPPKQRKTFRRRWPSLRRGLRSTLSRVTSGASPVCTTSSGRMLAVEPVSCPAGHALERFVPAHWQCPEHQELHCDQCGSVAALGVIVWGCRTCNFDVCEPCCRGEAVLKVVSVDESNDVYRQ